MRMLTGDILLISKWKKIVKNANEFSIYLLQLLYLLLYWQLFLSWFLIYCHIQQYTSEMWWENQLRMTACLSCSLDLCLPAACIHVVFVFSGFVSFSDVALLWQVSQRFFNLRPSLPASARLPLPLVSLHFDMIIVTLSPTLTRLLAGCFWGMWQKSCSVSQDQLSVSSADDSFFIIRC